MSQKSKLTKTLITALMLPGLMAAIPRPSQAGEIIFVGSGPASMVGGSVSLSKTVKNNKQMLRVFGWCFLIGGGFVTVGATVVIVGVMLAAIGLISGVFGIMSNILGEVITLPFRLILSPFNGGKLPEYKPQQNGSNDQRLHSNLEMDKSDIPLVLSEVNSEINLAAHGAPHAMTQQISAIAKVLDVPTQGFAQNLKTVIAKFKPGTQMSAEQVAAMVDCTSNPEKRDAVTSILMTYQQLIQI